MSNSRVKRPFTVLPLGVHAYPIIGLSKEEVSKQVKSFKALGWYEGGPLTKLQTRNFGAYVQVMVSLTATPAVEGSPRLSLIEKEAAL